MQIRLSDGERERLGCPELLDCDVTKVTVADAIALESEMGKPFPDLLDLMRPELDKGPDGNARGRYKPAGVQLLIWLGLYRAGVAVRLGVPRSI